MQENHLDNALAEEFAGKGEIIHKLKTTNAYFKGLMEENHKLWVEINNIQNEITPAEDTVLEDLEKKRLVILDEIGKLIAES